MNETQQIELSSADAEKALIGAALTQDRAFDIYEEAILYIGKDDFSSRKHSELWGAIEHLIRNDAIVDVVTVIDVLKSSKSIKSRNAEEYIKNLAADAPAVFGDENVRAYSHIVKNHSSRREAAIIAASLARIAREGAPDLEAAMAEQALALQMVQEHHTPFKRYTSLADRAENALQIIEDRAFNGFNGIATGIPELDSSIDGFKIPSYNFVFARPGNGKSMFSLGLALRYGTTQNVPSAFISLELDNDTVDERMLMAWLGMDRSEFNAPVKMEEKREKALKLYNPKNKIFCYNMTDSGLNAVLSTIQMLVMKEGVKFVALENFDLIGGTGEDHEGLRSASIALAKFKLQMANRGFPFCLVLVGQANREGSRTHDGFPSPAHVGGSEQPLKDCDLVVALADGNQITTMQDSKDDGFVDHTNELGVKVLKNRNGRIPREAVWVPTDFSRSRIMFPDMWEKGGNNFFDK